MANPCLIIRGIDKPFQSDRTFPQAMHEDSSCSTFLVASVTDFPIPAILTGFQGQFECFHLRSQSLTEVGIFRVFRMSWTSPLEKYLLKPFWQFSNQVAILQQRCKEFPGSSACKEMGKHFNAFHRLYLYFMEFQEAQMFVYLT